MSLTDCLNRILAWHTEHETPVARLLQPGLSDEQIAGMLKGLPFKLPREFVELYRWRNGVAFEDTEEDEDSSFFEYHRFLPLDEALADFQDNYASTKDFYDLADWTQVFQDPAGDGYGVSGLGKAAEYAPIVVLVEGEGAHVAFESLTKMMETVAAAFDEGAMSWQDGELETDFFGWGDIAHRLNPSIQYWRDYVKGA